MVNYNLINTKITTFIKIIQIHIFIFSLSNNVSKKTSHFHLSHIYIFEL